MKTTRLFCLLLVLALTAALNISAQNSNGCVSGKRNGIFYTDCWVQGMDPDDTIRLQNAIDLATGSKLIFNESSYEVSDSLWISSFTILEGTSANTATGPSMITMTSNGESIFRIGAGIREVTIRDLGLRSDGKATGTIGILAQDEEKNNNSSIKFHFNNIRFAGLAYGIWVKPYSQKVGWQFDNVHLDDSTFDGCDNAVYLDVNDTGWQMNSILIASGKDQNGIYIKQGGYISMNEIIGNGQMTGSPAGLPDKFIYIQGHSVISIQNSVAENYKLALEIDGIYRNQPIYLINNGFPACPYDNGKEELPTVVINNSVVVSSGNSYACFTAPARPVIRGWSDVFSTGDKFCYDGSEYCTEQMTSPRSQFVVEGATSTLNSSNVTEDADYSWPLKSIIAGYNGKVLLELGTSTYSMGVMTKYKYDFSRNSTDGWLDLEGSQGAPYVGYRFKGGPVQLTSSTQTDLSSYSSTATSGSMLYCSDCTAPSTPCSGSGSGALALKVGSAWHCK